MSSEKSQSSNSNQILQQPPILEEKPEKPEGMPLTELPSSSSNVIGTTSPTSQSRWRQYLPLIFNTRNEFFGAEEFEVNNDDKDKKGKKPFTLRHHQMLNLTSGIGMGLFVTSGRQLAIGGPASLMINNSLMTIVLYIVSCAMCEVSMRYPVSGSFIRYSRRFINPVHGFSMGWIYFGAYMFTFGAESGAICFTLQYWVPDAPKWAVALGFLGIIALIHAAPPYIFAEVEFFIGIFRIFSVTGFIFWTIFMLCGYKRGDSHETPKFGQYYRSPGPFNQGIKGLINAAILAAFSNGGIEIGAVASGDVSKPRFSIPRTIKAFRFRMSLFYILSLFCVSLLLSSDDPALQSDDKIISPFVHALNIYGYPELAHIFNVNIFLSVLSVANCCMYVTGQILSVMAEDDNAPKWFAKKNHAGKPARAIYVSYVFGTAVVMAAAFSNEAFEWLATNTGMVFLMIWISIIVAFLMYRFSVGVQGEPDTTTPFLYKMRFWLVQGIIALSVLGFLFGGQIYIAASPMEPAIPSARGFFKGCFPILMWVILSIGYTIIHFIRFKKAPPMVKISQIDLQKDLHPEDKKETTYIYAYNQLPRWRRGITHIPFVKIPIDEEEIEKDTEAGNSTVLQHGEDAELIDEVIELEPPASSEDGNDTDSVIKDDEKLVENEKAGTSSY